MEEWEVKPVEFENTCFWFRKVIVVLGLARTGLIFTRIQEGAQLGGLTPPGQTEQGIPYHVPSCWVLVGGSWGQELTGGSGARAPVQSGRTVLWVMLFVLCFLLIWIVVVTVPFVCCSVKLPLPPPTSFFPCFFPFSSAPQRGWGGRVVLLLPAAAKWEQSWWHRSYVLNYSLDT